MESVPWQKKSFGVHITFWSSEKCAKLTEKEEKMPSGKTLLALFFLSFPDKNQINTDWFCQFQARLKS